MRDNDECLKRPPVVSSKENAALLQTPMPPTELSPKQEEAHKEMMTAVKELSDSVQQLENTAKNMMHETELIVQMEGSSTKGQLQRIEEQLVALNTVTPAPPPPVPAPIIVKPPNNTVFENKIVKMIKQVQESLVTLGEKTPASMDLTAEDRSFLETLSNETLRALEYVKHEMHSNNELGRTR